MVFAKKRESIFLSIQSVKIDGTKMNYVSL